MGNMMYKDVYASQIANDLFYSFAKSEYFQNYKVEPFKHFDAEAMADRMANNVCQGIESVLQFRRFMFTYPKSVTTEALKQMLDVFTILTNKVKELCQPKRFSIIYGYVNIQGLTEEYVSSEITLGIEQIQRELKERKEQ